MIALIEFKDNLVITREEAQLLKLNFEDGSRFGKACSYDRKIEPLADGNYYTDELYEDVQDDISKYYTDESKTKEITDYYRYERIDNKDWVHVKKGNNLVDLEYFALNCRFPYSIVKCIKSDEPSIQNISNILQEMENKFTNISDKINAFDSQQFNQKLNIHVGGGLIVTYNELMLKENICTDVLQSTLNEGWRIIAVCVQPDQRRPDYILGRYNSDFDVDTGAKR